MEWLNVTLDQITTRIGDGLHGTPKYDLSGDYFFINGNNLSGGKIIIKDDTKRISKDVYNKIKKELNNRTLLVAINGTLGNLALYQGEKIALGKSACYINLSEDVNKDFIRYVLEHNDFQQYARSFATGATIKNLGLKAVRDYSFKLPPLPTQKRIASILSAYDDLIENNSKRIKLLEEIAQRTYEEWFVKFRVNGEQLAIDEDTGLPLGWEFKKAEQLFNIKIGKTPPREQENWFRTDSEGIKWASIKDINNASVFISNTSERITNLGVEKFNMNVAQRGTVILSFKLTVGKVTIVTEDMVTNEAIAHFNYTKDCIFDKSFIYVYLKRFNYHSLGSTSSIGTAINSKIVKAMPFLVPDITSLNLFQEFANPLFDQIEQILNMNFLLKQSRDILLPRLMSGTINIES
ncbi:MAG: restriction endonuclease subunit S [Bacteroidia bacterium]|nr:restriction endonuclease subunit S [Bacteroidia bacterium]